MREFERVFGPKNWCILLLLCFMNIGIFFFCVDAGKEITLTGEELQLYAQEYPEFLDRTISQGQKMLSMGLFRSGYAREHMEQSTALYSALAGTKVTLGDNRGPVLWIQYKIGDILLLFYLVCLVYDLQAEKRKGLLYVVRSTVGGRGKLFLTRVLVLLAGTVQAVVFFSGTSLLCVKYTFGLAGMDRSVQSLPEFMRCPYRMTIGQFLCVSILVSAAGVFMTALLLFLMMSCFGKLLGFIVPIVFAGIEAAFYLLIPGVSSFKLLKYVNLWAIVFGSDYFKDAVFFRLFGHCVEAFALIRWILILLTVFALITGMAVHSKGYFTKNRLGERILDKAYALKEKFAFSRPLFGWEFYKLYIRQGALFLLVGAVVIQTGLAFQYEYYYPVNAMERLYYIKYQGEVTEERIERVEHEMELLETAEKRYRTIMQNQLEAEVFNSLWYDEARQKLEENLAAQKGLLPVYEVLMASDEYAQRTGKNLWLVEPYSYDVLICRDEQTRNRASFLELLVILAAVGGVYAIEKQNHMHLTIRTAAKGRLSMWVYKPILIVLFCSLAAVLLHGVQLLHVVRSMGLPCLDVPVQSLLILRDFPLTITIKGYLILTFLYRCLTASLVGLAVALFGSLWKDRFMAMGAGAAALIILMAVAMLFPTAEYISPIYWLGCYL